MIPNCHVTVSCDIKMTQPVDKMNVTVTFTALCCFDQNFATECHSQGLPKKLNLPQKSMSKTIVIFTFKLMLTRWRTRR